MRARAPIGSKASALLEARAYAMRKDPSAPEAALYRALSARQLGVAFRRQVPIAGSRFIADFLAPKVRLIVEVDGGSHALRRAADARRDRKLRRLGYRVLRLEAELVLHELPLALELIRQALKEPS